MACGWTRAVGRISLPTRLLLARRRGLEVGELAHQIAEGMSSIQEGLWKVCCIPGPIDEEHKEWLMERVGTLLVPPSQSSEAWMPF